MLTRRGWRAADWLHRPEPIEPPGPDDPDEDDDAPPDPDRLPGEPLSPPIGDPPPNYAPQSVRMMMSRRGCVDAWMRACVHDAVDRRISTAPWARPD
ncbi:MAG TPA: hypothetical protein VGN31_15645 [Paraburkholderia sp.]